MELMIDDSNRIRVWHMLMVRDYEILANAFDLLWAGDELPTSGQKKTLWWCKRCGDSFNASYRQVCNQHGCGERHEETSIPQVLTDLAAQMQRLVQPERLAFFPTFCGFFTDMSVVFNGVQLVVFLDTPKFHAKQDEQEQDNYRSQILQAAGYRVLRIRSGGLLPSDDDLAFVLTALSTDKSTCILTMADWTGVEWKPSLK